MFEPLDSACRGFTEAVLLFFGGTAFVRVGVIWLIGGFEVSIHGYVIFIFRFRLGQAFGVVKVS